MVLGNQGLSHRSTTWLVSWPVPLADLEDELFAAGRHDDQPAVHIGGRA